jgi:hypothetical protein
MSEIKIGEYVRTKDGRIEKVKEINKYGVVTKHDNNDDTFSTEVNWYAESGREINKEDILEHSFKIIDLIEIGDYVNGKKVLEKIGNFYLNVSSSSINDNRIFNNMIYTIVTKEQFERMGYKL